MGVFTPSSCGGTTDGDNSNLAFLAYIGGHWRRSNASKHLPFWFNWGDCVISESHNGSHSARADGTAAGMIARSRGLCTQFSRSSRIPITSLGRHLWAPGASFRARVVFEKHLVFICRTYEYSSTNEICCKTGLAL